MIRIRRGTALLNKVVKQFDQAVADLEAAVGHIAADKARYSEKVNTTLQKNLERESALREKHSAKMQAFSNKNVLAEDKLRDKENELHHAGIRAQTVRDNIAKLVGA